MGKRGRRIVRTGAQTSDEAQDHVLYRVPPPAGTARHKRVCNRAAQTRVSCNAMDISPSGKVRSERCTHLSAAPLSEDACVRRILLRPL